MSNTGKSKRYAAVFLLAALVCSVGLSTLPSRIVPLYVQPALAEASTTINQDITGEMSSALFRQYTLSPSSVTISNPVFSMTIPANTPYHMDIEQRVLNFCQWVETASGLSFNPPGKPSVPLVISNDGGVPWADSSGINVDDVDYILDTPGAEYVYLHELTHVLQARLVEINCPPFVEAFAILNSAKAAQSQGLDYLQWYIMSFNYADMDASAEAAIISPDVEQYFRANTHGWDNYLFGFRFGVYLEERYGSEIFTTIIKNYGDKAISSASSSNAFVDFLKTQTSADVFTQFVDWYWANTDLFSFKPFPVITADHVTFMPIINTFWQEFVVWDRIAIDETVTLDFRDSHAYAQLNGYTAHGISAHISVTETMTIDAYDKDSAFLETITVTPGSSQTLTFPRAALLIVSGTQSTLAFRPDFERCYTK